MSRRLRHTVLDADTVKILRSQRTHQYFTGDGWTNAPTHAQPFPNAEEAMRACVAYELQEVELVFCNSSGGEVLSTPIR